MATKKKPAKKAIKKTPVKVKRADESNDDPVVFDKTGSNVSSVLPVIDPSGVVVMKPEQDYDSVVDPSLVVTIKPPVDN